MADSSLRRLQEDVEHAQALSETDPEAFAATARLPEAARDLIPDDGDEGAAGVSARRRQIGARPTVSGETFRLFFRAAREEVTRSCAGGEGGRSLRFAIPSRFG